MKLRMFSILVVMIISFLGGAVFQSYAGQDGGNELLSVEKVNSQEAAKVIVHEGDTLWSIARQHVSDGDDIREMIAQIKDVNQLSTSILQIGQVLIIP